MKECGSGCCGFCGMQGHEPGFSAWAGEVFELLVREHGCDPVLALGISPEALRRHFGDGTTPATAALTLKKLVRG